MARAAEIIVNSPEERKELRRLNFRFWQELQDLPHKVTLNGPTLDLRHPGNLNVSFAGFDGRSIIGALQPKVAASSGSACTSGVEEPSYVLRSIGRSDDQARSAVRFGIGRQTNSDDIAVAVSHIGRALERLERLT
jgi:cysteine desulfurase